MAQETPVPGLYVHIPFCASRCEYCDFFSVTDKGLMAGFMQALLGEIDACRGEFREFDTVYLGGGTPSLLPLQQLERILDKIRRVFRILPGAEIT
ncbi:MAG: coproporphyrinogen III oxidase family protein, partial [Desulfobacterota bacterium]|nr:coproporphyrinogen III oxidase family protein [Thermodesulfobacteriota bacterium]